MVKASRRAIFRGFFRRSSFELDHATANEILMRINQSLDPIPLTEGMWASYVAARRGLRYAQYDERGELQAAPGADGPQDVADFGELSASVAKDLAFLLRVETLMRLGAAAGAAPNEAPSADPSRRVLDEVSREIHRYLDGCEETEQYRRDIVDPVLKCLADAAGIQAPPQGGASE